MLTDPLPKAGGVAIPGPGRRLEAVMFTDIVGYTALTQKDEGLALELLEEHRQVLRPIFESHTGQIVKTMGDAFLVEFDSAVDAVGCGVSAQKVMAVRNSKVAETRRLEIRIGIHAGDVVRSGGDIYGDTVNLASRVEKLADPGGVALSASVYEQVRNQVNFAIEEMGRFTLKNVEVPALVYRVVPTWKGASPGKKEDVRRRIAVIPFVNIGGSQADEFLADGLTEEVISSLSTVSGLKVIARTTVMRYKGTSKSVSEIGDELKVGAVLEGSIRRSANRIRATVSFVETPTEEHLWAQNYDTEMDDFIKVQQDIAERTAGSLTKFLGREPGKLSRKAVAPDGEAYILYMRGRYHLAKQTGLEVKEAAELFRRALSIDPTFAPAFAMLAQCDLFLGFFGFISPHVAFERARPLLTRALEIDEDQPVAHMLMGRYLIDKEWDWSGAESEYERAIELAPNNPEAHYRYALLLHDFERHDEAIAEMLIAEELDPLSVAVNQTSGTIFYYAGRYGEAILRFQRALEVDPGAMLVHNNLGLAYFQTGVVDRAVSEVKSAVDHDPNNMMYRTDLCYLYSQLGRTEEAEGLLHDAESQSQTHYVPPIAIAGMHACIGDSKSAMEWLEKALSEHSPYLSALRVERWFDEMKTDGRFVALLKKIGLL